MLRAVIFDFNGVVVDDERIHFECFREVLAAEGLPLGEEDYYARYLGLDDRGCFQAAFAAHGRSLSADALSRLIERKSVLYNEAIRRGVPTFPGVERLLRDLAARYPLAIASGALGREVETLLAALGLRSHFSAIVAAEDVPRGKPDPAVFIEALARLNRDAPSPIPPSRCLVIEDSREGIEAARAAGMRCLAVANSYPPEALASADAVVRSLADVDIRFLEGLVTD